MHDVENDDKMSNVIVEKYQSNIDNNNKIRYRWLENSVIEMILIELLE